MSDQKIEIPEGEYASFLAEKAAQIAAEKTKKADSAWRALIGIGIGTLGVLGYSNITSLREDTRTLINADIKETIRTEVETAWKANQSQILREEMAKLEKRTEDQVNFFQLIRIADELKENTSFSNAKREEATALLRKLKDSPIVGESISFASALEDILDSFAAANLLENVLEIERDFREICIEKPGIIQTMTFYIGLRCLADAEASPAAIEGLDRYLSACAKHRIAIYYPYKMLTIYRERGADSKILIESLIEELRRESDDKREIVNKLFHSLMEENADSSLVESRVAAWAKRFWIEYESKITK
jgi:hypothetical protein